MIPEERAKLRDDWRAVSEFTDRYEVSSLGQVRSWVRGHVTLSEPHLLAQQLTRGYPTVSLYRRRKTHIRYVSGLVLEAFCGPRPLGFHAAHLNGNRLDNRLCNLRWCTPKENESHKYDHGTALLGMRHHQSKLTDDDVRRIRADYRSGMAAELASHFGVDKRSIYHIVRYRTWKHLP